MFLSCDAPAKDLPGTHCKMDGFNKVPLQGGPPNGQFAYVPRSETKPYWDMAHEWVLADHMFALAARRKLRRASVHHRGAGALERRRSQRRLGLRTPSRATKCKRSRTSARTASFNSRASTTRRSATNSTKPACRGASTRAGTISRSADSGRVIRRSITFTTVRTGRKT